MFNNSTGKELISKTSDQVCVQNVSSTTGQIKTTTNQHPSTMNIVNWVEKAYKALQNNEVMPNFN